MTHFEKEKERLTTYVGTGVINKIEPFINTSKIIKKDYSMKRKEETFRNCKYTNNKVIEDINESYFICGKKDKILKVKFLNIKLPERKNDSQYIEIKEYVRKLFSKRSHTINVLGEEDGVKYAYIFYGKKNINYTIIQKQYPFVTFKKDIFDEGLEKLKEKLK